MWSDMMRVLGRGAGCVARYLASATCGVGWFGTSYFGSALVNHVVATGYPDVGEMLGQIELFMLFTMLLSFSIWLETPVGWLDGSGLGLGFQGAVLFSAITLGSWLFSVPHDGMAADVGGSFLLATEVNLGLWGLAARRDWDRVTDACHAFRLWIDGADNDGTYRIAARFEPFVPSVLFWLALRGSLWPMHTARYVRHWSIGVFVALTHEQDVGAPSALAAPILDTHHFWVIMLGVAVVLLVATLRRIGAGSLSRGMDVWLRSLGISNGGIVILRELYFQLNQEDLGDRLVSAMVMVLAACLVWYCHDHRN